MKFRGTQIFNFNVKVQCGHWNLILEYRKIWSILFWTVQIVFPLGHVPISTAPVENAKQFIKQDNYLVERNISKRRSHTRLQNRWWSADACRRPPKLRLCPSEPFVWPARSSEAQVLVFHLQHSCKKYSSSQEGKTPETGGMPKMRWTSPDTTLLSPKKRAWNSRAKIAISIFRHAAH